MNIIIAPVSGGKFINQLSASYSLSKYDYKPDIYLGASGGIVTGTILVAADYNPNSIIRLTRLTNSALFIKSWLPWYLDFIPSSSVGVFQGSLYQSSGGHEELIFDHITPAMLRETEIWTLTCDETNRRPSLWCSTSYEKAKITGQCTDNSMIKTSFDYIDGDLQLFADSALASASIPAVVPPKEIKGAYHVDGGVLYASPFIPLQAEIELFESVHLIYLNCTNIESFKKCKHHHEYSILDVGTLATEVALKNHIVQDRSGCYHTIKNKAILKGKVLTKMESVELSWYFVNKGEWDSSLLEAYPETEFSLDITNFSGDDAVKYLLERESVIRYRLWFF